MRPKVKCKRVYDAAEPGDGHRVLVDRLWPRGLKRDRAAIEEWLKPVAPSNELRRWYGHEPERWQEFQRRYREELSGGEAAAALKHLRSLARDGGVTLLTATRAEFETHLTVLEAVLRELD